MDTVGSACTNIALSLCETQHSGRKYRFWLNYPFKGQKKSCNDLLFIPLHPAPPRPFSCTTLLNVHNARGTYLPLLPCHLFCRRCEARVVDGGHARHVGRVTSDFYLAPVARFKCRVQISVRDQLERTPTVQRHPWLLKHLPPAGRNRLRAAYRSKERGTTQAKLSFWGFVNGYDTIQLGVGIQGDLKCGSVCMGGVQHRGTRSSRSPTSFISGRSYQPVF